MTLAPVPPDDAARLRALREAGLLDAPLTERFERITRLAQKMMRVPIAAISLIDEDRQWFASIQGLPVAQTPRNVAFCAHTIMSEEVTVVEDARRDDRFRANPLVTGGPGIVFYAGCPIHAPDGSPIGSLCVIDTRPRPFDADERDALCDLTAIVEAEIAAVSRRATHAELCEQVAAERRRALVDPLTRVWNREGVLDVIDATIDQARSAPSTHAAVPIGVIMIDLDHFKAINDTHGHAVGDEVLREVARRMLRAARDTDAVGRVGGEEFVVALDEFHGPDEALAIAERIRLEIEQRPVCTSAGPVAVTASLGVCIDAAGGTLRAEQLLERADAAMYRAKRQGRNQVAWSTPPRRQPSPPSARQHG